MQTNMTNIKFLVGNSDTLEAMENTRVLPMFSAQVVEFLSALSKALLTDNRNKKYVDIYSYGYWIRKASLVEEMGKYPDYNMRLGRGVAFHIAPSNVPVNFAVSMTSSLLAGNPTVIRVSDKEFEQVDIICEAINNLLNSDYEYMKNYICIIRYNHSVEITQQLTDICSVRVIWGGNKTISEVRKAQLPPRAIEMTFADRHSLAIINSDEYMQGDYEKIAKGFYTDTYYSDQNACSSPRMVIWTGSRIEEAKKIFWNKLSDTVIKQYDMKPIQAVDKYNNFCNLAMSRAGIKLVSTENVIMRVEVDTLTKDLMNYKGNGGYFLEYSAKDISEIVPILTKECQTISYYGLEKDSIITMLFDNGVKGVDRIVPLGQTMGLEFIWDGYKMIEAMSRVVY